MNRFTTLLLVAMVVTGFFFVGPFTAESDIPVDRLYALYLDAAPTEAQWQKALPRLVSVRGGQVNAPKRLGDVDEDIVHTSTASCHHGSSLPEPVLVDMRAFYTDRELFLRLEWYDATRNDSMSEWSFDGKSWTSGTAYEDGFGLMWDTRGAFSRFTCSHACHISDFGVSGDNFHARNRMQLARAGMSVDLWNWKAGRTGRHGFVDDRLVDDRGMHGDVPGELFRPNSARVAADPGAPPFGSDDQPLLDAKGEAVESGFRVAGSTAPGYLTDRPVGSRADIAAHARYENDRWIVVLRRPLDTGDPNDVRFLPGDVSGVAFGLSLMDNTLDQHYASKSEERLVLLPRDVAIRSGEE